MTNDEILERHRKACSMWPKGRPETHSERGLRVALDHIKALMYGHDNPHDQRKVQEAADEFLREHGRL
jgi:hypothetical protein